MKKLYAVLLTVTAALLFTLPASAAGVDAQMLEEHPYLIWALPALVVLLVVIVILRCVFLGRAKKHALSEETTVEEKEEEVTEEPAAEEVPEAPAAEETAEEAPAEEPAPELPAEPEEEKPILVELIPSFAEEREGKWILHSEILIDGEIPVAEKQDFVPTHPVEPLPMADETKKSRNFIYYGGFHDGYQQGVEDAKKQRT